jgi:Protein of unknown function (DUF3631)
MPGPPRKPIVPPTPPTTATPLSGLAQRLAAHSDRNPHPEERADGVPVPGNEKNDEPSRDSRDSQDRRDFGAHAIGRLATHIRSYIAMPDMTALVIACWVAAAYLIDVWDRFPHLCIVSPEKRCGKTTLLDVLFHVVPKPRPTSNISAAALYRLVELDKPTLLMDEAQSLSRRGSEQSEVIREMLNAGIGKIAKVTRCGGERYEEIVEFSVYCPKAFAMIGTPDGVLGDRSLPALLKRKTNADVVKRYRSKHVENESAELREALSTWTAEIKDAAAKIYDSLEPFTIQNDRMAELLLPLQTVLALAELGTKAEIDVFPGHTQNGKWLMEYAFSLDARDKEIETQTPGVRLLTAIREIFREQNTTGMRTTNLILHLASRVEEPWATYCRGTNITPEALANLLRPYGIRSSRNKDQAWRGYFAVHFQEAWKRYLV